MSGHWGIPGPGGSLGKCAICDESFVKETILGKSVAQFTIKGIEPFLYGHDPCITILKQACKEQNYKLLPAGPLRTVFEEQEAEDLKAEKEVPF